MGSIGTVPSLLSTNVGIIGFDSSGLPHRTPTRSTAEGSADDGKRRMAVFEVGPSPLRANRGGLGGMGRRRILQTGGRRISMGSWGARGCFFDSFGLVVRFVDASHIVLHFSVDVFRFVQLLGGFGRFWGGLLEGFFDDV